MAKARFSVRDVNLDRKKLITIAEGPQAQRLTKDQCEQLVKYAVEVFDASETEPGNRESVYTPPFYRQSFEVRRVGKNRWRVVNKDPGTNLVEWGAHPGNGPTFALGYRPMRRALDRMGNDND